MIKKYQGIISDADANIFLNKVNAGSLTLPQYSLWKNELDGIIAASYLLSPSFIQIDEYVFLYDLISYNDYENREFIEDLKGRFGDKKSIERYVNCVCLGDLLVNNQQYVEDLKLLNMFADCLIYFWNNRLKQIFPNKNFEFEKENDINGDLGLCFTFYEV